MLIVVVGLLAVNVIAWRRLRLSAPAPSELAINLACDLAGFTLLLFLSGGIGNPFSLFFVLHAVLITMLLRGEKAVIGVALVVVCVVGLTFVHLPLNMVSGTPVPSALLDLAQVASLVTTAAITAWFVMRIVATLREHDRRLNQAVQQALRDEAVLRVGALAAGAAHELGTPLTTMALLAQEIGRDASSEALKRNAQILSSQIGACRETLAELMAAAGHARAVGGGRERLDRFLESIAARCAAAHPGAVVVRDWSGILPAPDIFADQALRQAVTVLVDNAIDASPRDVRVVARRDADRLSISICDRGPGFAVDEVDKRGRKFFTTKAPGAGVGLGLVLAARAIERLNGTIAWASPPGGGTCANISLPMVSVVVEERSA